MQFGKNIKDKWLLDTSVTFLNHGSFGATPKSIIEECSAWMRKLETQPVSFFLDIYFEEIRNQAVALAEFTHCNPDNLVFVENATTGVNTVINSLISKLKSGDEILITNHTYPAVKAHLNHVSKIYGYKIKEIILPFPVFDLSNYSDIYRKAISDKTKLAIVDHVIYTTGIINPINEITKVLKENGVLVMIDGAHAPGMLDLNIDSIGADFYTGNCHKWLYTPKGVALLWVADEHKNYIKPISNSFFYEQGFTKEFDWTGTKNPANIFCTKSAIEFYNKLGGSKLRSYMHNLAIDARDLVESELGLKIQTPESYFASLVALPLDIDIEVNHETTYKLRKQFYTKYKIEMPFIEIGGKIWFRFSCQVYNELSEYKYLADSLSEFKKELSNS